MRRQRECNWFTLFILSLRLHTANCQCSGSPLTVSALPSPSSFSTPGYPTSYNGNLYCEWLVDSGVAGQPVLLYSDNLDVVCADSVSIYDGNSASSPALLSSKCGRSQTTSNIQSSDRYALVTFTTDSADSGQGFEMTYISAADTSANGCSSEYVYTASTASQYLTSPDFPAQYAASTACRWVLTAPGSLSFLTVELVWSDIEEDVSCAYDQLYIYDGAYICENTLLHMDCSARTAAGSTPVTLTSTSNSVLVIFTSDGSYNRYGFVLKYTATIVTTTTPPVTSSTTTDGNASGALATGTSNTEKEINIPLMFASALGGAVVSLLTVVLVWRIKRIATKKKKTKPGLMTAQAIAPLPPRSTFLLNVRPSTTNRNALSFV